MRSGLQFYDLQKRQFVLPGDDGVLKIWDQREYVVSCHAPLPAHPALRPEPLTEGCRGRLRFRNYVGLAELGGQRIHVQHAKLTAERFDALLTEVVEEVADLAFGFSSPTALPFGREDLGNNDEVLYHALAYLRNAMNPRNEGDVLSSQFAQIARQPHRRMTSVRDWLPTEQVAMLDGAGIAALVAHPDQLALLTEGSPLARSSLARALSGGREAGVFPMQVLGTVRSETFDNHENRLVRHVLHLARDIVDAFVHRPLQNPELRANVIALRRELDEMLRTPFLGGVGALHLVPLQSTVLQRREGYRDFLRHYLQLSLSSVLANDRNRWSALLDLKDCALLYEMWCFFAVKRELDAALGRPRTASWIKTDERHRQLRWALRLSYPGAELTYNRTYARGQGSYSVPLRPDIVVRVRRTSGGREALILDAKLKFDGDRLDVMTSGVSPPPQRTAARDDLYKMHAYRDAIREAVGAFVLFPGTDFLHFPESPGAPRWSGIGAIPLQAGERSERLKELLQAFIAGTH